MAKEIVAEGNVRVCKPVRFTKIKKKRPNGKKHRVAKDHYHAQVRRGLGGDHRELWLVLNFGTGDIGMPVEQAKQSGHIEFSKELERQLAQCAA